MFQTFFEGVPKWSSNLSNRSHSSGTVFQLKFPQGSPLLSLGLWPSDCSYRGEILGWYCLSLSSLWIQGLQNFQRDCFAPYWGILSLVLWWRSSRWSDSLLSGGVLSVAVFPHFLGGGWDQTEVIKEFVSCVIWGFYSQLTLSHSDFEKCRIH